MQKTTSLSLPVIHSQTVEGMGKKVAQMSYYVYILAIILYGDAAAHHH